MDLASGRSWRGRRIHVNLARYQSKPLGNLSLGKKVGNRDAPCFKEEDWPPLNHETNHSQSIKTDFAGWIIANGTEKGIRVAPWVVQEQKKNLFFSLIGFLKSCSDGLQKAEKWLDRCWGKKPVQIHLLDPCVVRMQFLSEQEVEDVLHCASSSDAPTVSLLLH